MRKPKRKDEPAQKDDEEDKAKKGKPAEDRHADGGPAAARAEKEGGEDAHEREEEHGWMLELYRYWKVADHASTEMVARRYVERFIGCVENVTNPKSGMSEKEKRQEIRKMLENPRLDKSLKVARPRSGYMKIMLLPIKWKSTLLTYLEAKVITFVKTKNTKLFTKLKVGR